MTENPDTAGGRLFFRSETFRVDSLGAGRTRLPRVTGQSITEPAREIPIHAECDVLVVGGGPAGTAAAVAAEGSAPDLLLERYNHLGGLSTGGLVIWIDRMTDWEGNLVIRGFAEEFSTACRRDGRRRPAARGLGLAGRRQGRLLGAADGGLPRHRHLVADHRPGADEARRRRRSCSRAGVELVFHAWARDADRARTAPSSGVVFESKAGPPRHPRRGGGRRHRRRRHVRAAPAPLRSTDIEEADVHHCMNTAWLFGGVDMTAGSTLAGRAAGAVRRIHRLGTRSNWAVRAAFVSWRNDVALFMGPRHGRLLRLDVDDLTEVEMRTHRADGRATSNSTAPMRPGFAGAWPDADRAATRRAACPSAGRRRCGHAGDVAMAGVVADEIGVSPSLSPKFRQYLGPLWRAGAGTAGRAAGARPPHVLRRHSPRLPARDPAMLADRPGGGRCRGAGSGPGGDATGGPGAGHPAGPAAAGRASVRAGGGAGSGMTPSPHRITFP